VAYDLINGALNIKFDGSPGSPWSPLSPFWNVNAENAAAAANPAAAVTDPPAAAADADAAAAEPAHAATDPPAAPADADASAAAAVASPADVVAAPACAVATSACANACAFAASAAVFAASAPVFAASAPDFAVSAPVFAVCACVLKVSVSVFICCNSDLYVVDTWRPKDDNDKLVSAIFTSTPFIEVDIVLPVFNSNSSLTFTLKLFISYLKSNNLVVELSDKTLPVFNPLQSNVVHNSLLAFTCNVSLYLALNLLVEKSINNGPASSTPLASNLGLKFFLHLFQNQNNQY